MRLSMGAGNIILINTGHFAGTAAGAFFNIKQQLHHSASFVMLQRMQR